MFLGILTLLTALSISAVAIYYSVAGLVAIFAAAAVPIMIMGGILEVSKLVTAVWLHRYWNQATWWLKYYLATAVLVLMFITSMGIFGFLSKAHIEQTSASQESVAQVERLTTEIARQTGIVERAEQQIKNLQSNGVGADANIQAQIDKEQERIDLAYDRINPAIAQQNKIIEDARAADGNRTKPYEDQLANIQAEILRLENSAKEYETSITGLEVNSSNVAPLLAQIANLEEEIIRVTNQINSGEQQQIRAGQAIIGVTSDGLFGGNTRTALAAWVAAQRQRIGQIQTEVAQVRRDAQGNVNAERTRLAGVVKDIRERQIPALKDRELDMLSRIDEVRQTESPAIATARDEIQRLRESAESQVAQSQALIQRLRGQLAQENKAADIEAAIDEQNNRIREANTQIDTLTEEKYALQAEYRKLEAEVGPIKYIAEFVYGEQADTNMLEEAVRWVIIIIIFVFDPLAVLLLIASQYTFEFHRKQKDDNGERLRQEEWREYEQARAQAIVDNPGFTIDDPVSSVNDNTSENLPEQKEEVNEESNRSDDEQPDRDNTINNGRDNSINNGGDNRESAKDTDGANETTVWTRDAGTDNVGGDTSVRVDEQGPVDTDEQEPQKIDSKKKNDTKSQEELRREADYELKEQDEEFQVSKTAWKEAHPDQTLKHYKNLYVKGIIDSLPWERSAQEDNYNSKSYQQNAEQNENTLFNKLSKK